MSVLAGCVMLLSRAAGSEPPPRIASGAGQPGQTGGAASYAAQFNGDGRYLFFSSQAGNLIADQPSAGSLDIFRYELEEGQRIRVSSSRSGLGGGNGTSLRPVSSHDGRFVAFESTATNLVYGDTNACSDVFLRDLELQSTFLISAAAGGAGSASGPSQNPRLTPDGRWIVFESAASNLVSGDLDEHFDVFRRDRVSGELLQLSLGLGPEGEALDFTEASVSANGNWTAFVGRERIRASGTNWSSRVYLRDAATATTRDLSSNILAILNELPLRAFDAHVSADGADVLFLAGNAATNILRYAVRTGMTTVLASNVWAPRGLEYSANAQRLLFEAEGSIWVWDAASGSNSCVSVTAAGVPAVSGRSQNPALSADGLVAAYFSEAGDLVPGWAGGTNRWYVRDLVTGQTQQLLPESLAIGGEPSLSPDGRWLAFDSASADLVPRDVNHSRDVFVQDRATRQIELVSRAAAGAISDSRPGHVRLGSQCLSTDGRYLTYTRSGTWTSAAGDVPRSQAFVEDLETGDVRPADAGIVSPGEPASPRLASWASALSANGEYVAYVRSSQGASESQGQIWLRPRAATNPFLVSIQGGGSLEANGSSEAPCLSGNGRRVAFQSAATDLISGQTSRWVQVFVYDREEGTMQMASPGISNTYGNSYSVRPVLSRDGRWLAFRSTSTDLTDPPLTTAKSRWFVRDLDSARTQVLDLLDSVLSEESPVFNPGSTHMLYSGASNKVWMTQLDTGARELIATNAACPAMSADARFVAYQTRATNNEPWQIMMFDRITGATQRVSRSATNSDGGNASSTRPVVSYDGRYVVFSSRASNLIEGDLNQSADVFIRDVVAGSTLLASARREDGWPGQGSSYAPVLGADGRTVVFLSAAPDVAWNDWNSQLDYLVVRLGAGDADGDELEDDWEMAYFGTLVRDGTGDADGDQATEREEFQAGTDPTNLQSAFRVITVSSSSGAARLIWSARPGRTYRPQSRDEFGSPAWSDFPATVTATNSTASAVDLNPAALGRRFYRVVLLP